MLNFNPKYYYLRHENEILKFVNNKTVWIHIINEKNSFKNFTHFSKNIFNLDLSKDTKQQLTNLEKNKYDLIVVTDIFEVTDNIFELLESLNNLLTNNGKILINSINTKWNFPLIIFEKLKLKKISRPRSYIHLKKIYSISESSGFEIVRSYTRQIFPFKLMGIGDIVNKLFEILFFKLDLGINTYLLLSKKSKNYNLYSKTIIVPAKNEEKNLEPLVSKIPKFNSLYEIVIVVASSTDNTLEEAYKVQNKYKDLPILVIEQQSKGKGPGVLEAINGSKYELITILDSDLSIDPETLLDFFSIIEEGRADFVNGTRFVYRMEKGAMRKLNSFGNVLFQFFISIVISTKLTDSLCGTKVFNRNLVSKMNYWSNSLFFKDPFGDFDFIFSAAYHGEKILEYPVHYKARTYGTTQISRFSDGLKLFLYFFNSLIKFNSSKNVKSK